MTYEPHSRGEDHLPRSTVAERWASALATDDLAGLIPYAVVEASAPNAVVVHAIGPALGSRECPAVIDVAQRAIAAAGPEARFAVLDLGEIRTFSAMGVGLCTDFAKRAREKKLEPVLFGLRGDLVDQLRMFKIDRLYKVVRSKTDLAALLR
jgi:anti-anti-sigma regulatory factor